MSRCPLIPPTIILIAISIGCGPKDNRLAELAQSTSQEQAQQNERMAILQQEVAAGSRQLVEAESRMSADFLSLQRDLQNQSAEISRQLDVLEGERKALASERRTAPIVAAAINAMATLIACLLPLIIGIYLLRPPGSPAHGEALTDFLIDELMNPLPQPDEHAPRVTSVAGGERVLSISSPLS